MTSVLTELRRLTPERPLHLHEARWLAEQQALRLLKLQGITEEREGLREVMVRHDADIRYVDVDTELVRVNLNTPEDYAAAFERWGQKPAA